MTKKLEITLKLYMHVPDDWELHRSVYETDMIKLPNGQYLDMTYAPMVSAHPEEGWTTEGTYGLLEELTHMAEHEDVAYEFIP